MGVWCKDTRGSKMLDGEVRFGKDWADQVTQMSSWEIVVTATWCVHEHTCGLACSWLFVLLERTCVFASVCLFIF